MMKRFLWLIMFVMPVLSTAQGIRFENRLNWEQVKQKAKLENKYIFVDAYATWCGPCKKMENEVFPVKQVGGFINANFISVHVQMDTSKNDNEPTKAFYNDAHDLKLQYNISAFPTYLFFSPEGNIVHRYSGAMADTLFLKIAANALNSEKQYYTLLDAYKKGKKDYSKLSYLASISKLIGEDSISELIANDYLHNYLDKLSGTELLQKKHFDFVISFSSILTSKDKPFQLFYQDGRKVDDIVGRKGISQAFSLEVITKEEIQPRVWPNKKPISVTPDWTALTATLSKKYNNYYSDLAVLNAQVKWYHQKKDKTQEIKYIVKKFETYGLDTIGVGWAIINNIAYDLFLNYCNDKDTLSKMIHWMEVINKNHPDDQSNMDTYANLLYKVGRTKEAISWEEKAADLEEKAARKDNRETDKSFKETLDKMKNGVPTWVVK